jgi:hypothetical protein
MAKTIMGAKLRDAPVTLLIRGVYSAPFPCVKLLRFAASIFALAYKPRGANPRKNIKIPATIGLKKIFFFDSGCSDS